MTVLCEIRDLTVAYPGDRSAQPALYRVDLEIHRRERLAVIGESGSGKTTLALALAGLLPARSKVTGIFRWPGLDRSPEFDRSPELGRDLGFVFQDPGASLNPVLAVGDQVAEVVRTHQRVSWSSARAAALDLFERVSLPEPGRLASAYPHQLSGGQRQRVAIAAALAGQPQMLIADEPTSALDTIVQADIMRLLDRLAREDGLTLLLITHDIALAGGFADRIAVLRAGRLVEVGSSRDIVDTLSDAYTTHLLASRIDLDTVPLVGGVLK